MRVPKQYELTLNSETFAALKADFDLVLKKTLSNMQKKGSEAAEVKVSLKISFASHSSSCAGEAVISITYPPGRSL